MPTQLVPIKQIKIGERFRKDVTDVTMLSRSIADIGLLHPIVLAPDLTLIAGARRIKAYKELGRQEIEATIIDIENPREAERDENAQRKDLTVSEALEVEAYFAALEKPKAKEREREGGKCKGYAKFADPPGEVRKKAAKAAGYSHETLRKARAVKEAADSDPKLAPVAEEMERTGKVHPAYKAVKRHRRTKAEVESDRKKGLERYYRERYETICGLYEDLPRQWKAKVRTFIAQCEDE